MVESDKRDDAARSRVSTVDQWLFGLEALFLIVSVWF